MAPERDACAISAAERQDDERQRADQQDRLHLVFQTKHAQPCCGRERERARGAGAAAGGNQDHQCKNDRQRRDKLAAQNA